ncbi:hypothetical protein ACJ72_01949 [Emergomyces africanus]|uniref:Bromo domain-containing protein n=1 Tax=Emergomyces africanus TaxID=1955775 RepID=A0A1B7P3T1_9EURO|nr:hypothetical protein ACJ72_01949 [Emergomyces africanus]
MRAASDLQPKSPEDAGFIDFPSPGATRRLILTSQVTTPCCVRSFGRHGDVGCSTPTVAPIVKDNNALSGRLDWKWGMPSLSSYTPFESLLFFQFLNTLDSRPSSFSSISELLTNNSFVRENETFDKARLTPQALEALYTDLVQAELQTREGTPSGHGPNGYSLDVVNSNPKKRKIQDPSSKQLLDVASHSTVIPALVARLYARYKERATREIEEEERKYTKIQDEIKKLEDGAHTPHTFLTIDGPSATPQVSNEVAQPKSSPTQPVPVASGVNVPRGPDQALEQGQTVQTPKYPEPGLVEGRADARQAPPVEGKVANAPNSGSTWFSLQPPQTQQGQHTGPQTNIQKNLAHSLAPSLASGSDSIPASQDQVPGRGSQPAISRLGRSESVTPATTTISHVSQPSQPSLPTPTTSSAQHQHQPQQQQRTTATFQPVQYSPPQAQMTQAPLGPNFPQPWTQKQSPSTPYAHVSPYANVPYSNSQLTGKSPLPLGKHSIYAQPDSNKPLQSPCGPPLEPSRQVVPGLPQQLQNDTRSRTTSREPHPSTPVSTPGPGSLDGLTSSFSAALNRRPARPSVDTSGSLTPWKKPSPIVVSKSPGSPLRPRPEDVSPISERAPSPIYEIERPSSKTRSKNRAVPAEVDSGPAGNTRQRKSTPARKDRATASPVSSPARATRNRSRGTRSNVSPDDESITDSGSVTRRKIKHEVQSTPAGISDDTEIEMRASRRLKALTQTQADEGLSRERGKRKRRPSESYASEDATQQPARQAPQYVQCTRNFPRTCAPIMNDVASHKYASIFAKPLTERDAPGYKDLIYRPQDIKSIKSAIHQGSKALTAATEAVNTPSGENVESPVPGPGFGTPSKSNGLLLKRSAELIPPKGIVNSAQLEMELMRVFANAVMFNPTSDKTFGSSFPMQSDSASQEGTQVSDTDEGGIINDTLEMYEDVEKAVSRWRAAERAVDDMGGKSMLSLRRGSASDINMDSADEVK